MLLETYETTDIFRGAFFLCKGCALSGIRIQDNGKRIARFLIEGKDLTELDKAYRLGKALVNPVQFREMLNGLRDMLFARLRQMDEDLQEEILRYDRERENQCHKKGN
jgi:hypothetical protein